MPHNININSNNDKSIAHNFKENNLAHTEPYDPTRDLSSYEHPVSSLLIDYSDQNFEIDRQELEQNKDQIIETLLNYKIEIVKIK